MALRSRIALLALAGVLSLVVIGALATGVRLTGSASGGPAVAPLVRSRFTDAPQLRLRVLAAGRLPGAVARAWPRAAGDGRVALAELRGRPVVVNFWASWCVPCRVEAPLLQRVWQRERGRVLILGVNQNDVRSTPTASAITAPVVAQRLATTARARPWRSCWRPRACGPAS